MDQPLISIALCTYNGEKYLADQLQSIIDQTYKNLEIIIVDDNSTDNTFAIATKYADYDSRIKCYRNEVNIGFNKNFEKALSLTTGDYISISDQDDVWMPNKIELLYHNIKDNWLIFSNSVYMNTDGSVTDRELLKDFLIKQNYKVILLNNYVTGHTTLFKREFLQHILPFPAIGFYDWWMGFIALYQHRLTYIDESLTRYRAHEQAVTNLAKYDKVQRGAYFFRMTINQLKVFLEYPDLKNDEREYISKLYNAFILKQNNYSAPLFKILLRDYDDLFAHAKARKGFSKLNFAYRSSKKQDGL